MKEILFLLIGLSLAAMIWIRFSPIDMDQFHVDPADADEPAGNGFRLIGREAPRFPGHPDTVLQAFIDIALNEPRTRQVEGGIDEGMISFVSRTKIMGFPDIITVKATDELEETKLSVISRARYGGSDWGVNRERLDRWLGEMEQLLRE